MPSRGKKKTTFAKLNRESRLREKRVEKAARKEARRNAPPEQQLSDGRLPDEDPATEPPASPEA
jgi:hypothetical protein